MRYGEPGDSASVTFKWDTANTSIGKRTIKVEIPPVEGEENTAGNVKAVTIEM